MSELLCWFCCYVAAGTGTAVVSSLAGPEDPEAEVERRPCESDQQRTRSLPCHAASTCATQSLSSRVPHCTTRLPRLCAHNVCLYALSRGPTCSVICRPTQPVHCRACCPVLVAGQEVSATQTVEERIEVSALPSVVNGRTNERTTPHRWERSERVEAAISKCGAQSARHAHGQTSFSIDRAPRGLARLFEGGWQPQHPRIVDARTDLRICRAPMGWLVVWVLSTLICKNNAATPPPPLVSYVH